MTILVIDVETTTYAKGNPFSRRNQLCYVGAYREGQPLLLGTDAILPLIKQEILSASRLVGFNIKFDLHWLRRYGIVMDSKRRVWDCQLAHFLLRGQKTPYPSLNDVLEFYGLPLKEPEIERDYWENGIDTPEIPPEKMIHYLGIDLVRTMQVYHEQRKEFSKSLKLYKLFQLQCQDLLVLEEMEWNGFNVDITTALERAKELTDEINEIERRLNEYCRNVSLNWDSPDHLSTFLYGGIIKVDRREVIGVYKSGAKVGKPRYKIVEDEVPLPRLFEPIPRSELKKEGYYSTDESFLRQLPKHPIVELLLDRSDKVKLRESFIGLDKIITKKDWNPGELHGQFNQCVAQTGRLSSSQPNQQNFSNEVKQLIRTKYE